MQKLSFAIQNLPKLKDHIRIFTDGSCWPNPNDELGSWAFIIQYAYGNKEVRGSGVSHGYSTNNRMEIQAVISAFEKLRRSCVVELVTDSEYVGKTIVNNIQTYSLRDFQGIKNGDLWKRLYQLIKNHEVYVSCIKGHSGQVENELCDKMAEEARILCQTKKGD